MEYLGKIVDINDPLHKGRCKILVYGIFGTTKLEDIPVDDLPWAYPEVPITFGNKGGGQISIPKKDQIVKVKFPTDSIYHPVYTSIEELAEDMIDEMKKDYAGFHSLLYDTTGSIKIYFAKGTGLMIDHGTSILNIKPNGNIVINHSGSSSTIELAGDTISVTSTNAVNISTPNTITSNSNYVHVNGSTTDVGANPIYSAVNGEPLMLLLKAMATAIDQSKFPISNGTFSQMVQSAESSILSSTVNTTP